MFSRVASFAILALPLLAVATPANVVRNDTPTTACCASTENVRSFVRMAYSSLTFMQAASAAATAILSLLGISASDITGLIGLTCSPVSVVGVGSGSECSGTTVSCSNGLTVSSLFDRHCKMCLIMTAQGSIGIGCVPVNV